MSRTSILQLAVAIAVGTTLLSLLPAQRRSEAVIFTPCGFNMNDSNSTHELSGFMPCVGDCGTGESCALTNATIQINSTFNITQLSCACLTQTPTATPTSTPTATPTNTLVPDGGTCDTPATCNSGNCVEGFCCDTACDQPGQDCGVPGLEGTCVDSAAAPVASGRGLWVAIAALCAAGALGMARSRRRSAI